MAMTIVETRAVTGGVDTHLDVHVAAVLDDIGGLLGVESFPTTPAGYQLLLAWLESFGTVARVGIEGTSSYGAGLARHLQAGGVTVIEVNRSDRAARRRQGKSDPLDAISRGPCGAIRPSDRFVEGSRRSGRSDPHVAGHEAVRPPGSDGDDQPDAGTGVERTGCDPHPIRPPQHPWPGHRGRRHAPPPR
jgi:hypothetical protein